MLLMVLTVQYAHKISLMLLMLHTQNFVDVTDGTYAHKISLMLLMLHTQNFVDVTDVTHTKFR